MKKPIKTKRPAMTEAAKGIPAPRWTKLKVELPTYGPREGYARNELSRWLYALENPDPLKKQKIDDDSARAFAVALERFTDSAVDRFGADAPEPIRSAIIIAAYRLAGTFERIAMKHPRSVQRLSKLWTEYPALVPILDGDRKRHLAEICKRIKPGMAAAGAVKVTRKAHSIRRTPINLFIMLLLNRGVIEYKGRQFSAPWRGGDINDTKPIQPAPPRPPYTKQEAARVIDEWIIPALRGVIGDRIKELQHIPALRNVLRRNLYSKLRSPINPVAEDRTPSDQVWNRVAVRLKGGMIRSGIILQDS